MKSARNEHLAIANATVHDITERAFISEKTFTPSSKHLKLSELAMLSIAPLIRTIADWWLKRLEHHYLICAEVEEQRAREAHMNVAYYQKRAVLARAARH